MNSYNSYSGKTYTLGQELGKGGEGIVCRVNGNSDIVAKIYKDSKFKTPGERSAMDRKLKTMINMNIPVMIDGLLRLAWPMDILYQNGSMVGFVMPCITAKCKIYDVQRADPTWQKYDPKNPFVQAYPDYNWKYLVQFAYNLAWIVKYMHSKGIVIGDLNQNNIYADTNTGAIILVDCDSFDIRDPGSGEHFPCEVGLPEMLAPELQKVGRLTNGTFTKETDNFSLAIHIFRLLMKNADPFGGVMTIQRSSSAVTANNAIVNGECVYVRYVPGKVIPPSAPALDMLPSGIQDLFQKTFDYDAATARRKIGKRATAKEWCDALYRLAAPGQNNALQQCSVSVHHIYPSSSSYCPWCRLIQQNPQLVRKPYQQQNQKQQQTTTQNTYANQGNSAVPRRSPLLFYIVLIAFGLASGFAFGDFFSLEMYSAFNINISSDTCTILISTVGVIIGALAAYRFQNKYIYANNALPWLLLGIVALFVPLLAAMIIAIGLYILLMIFALIFVLVIIVSMASGS